MAMATETHVAGVGGVIAGATGMDQLQVLLTGVHGIDTTHAGALAWWAFAAGAAIYGLIGWFISWRWPSIPPLPHHEGED